MQIELSAFLARLDVSLKPDPKRRERHMHVRELMRSLAGLAPSYQGIGGLKLTPAVGSLTEQTGGEATCYAMHLVVEDPLHPVGILLLVEA